MHDLSLGGTVKIGYRPEAKHQGQCIDGVYGCHFCHNLDETPDGECETCHESNVRTWVVQAWDEPCMYEYCGPCRAKNRPPIEEEEDDIYMEQEDALDAADADRL